MSDMKYMQDADDLDFLDFSVSIGRPAVPSVGFYVDKNELVGEMERVGVKEAVVYHVASKEYQSVYGNDALMNEISGNEMLIPSWILVPSEDEMGCNPADFITRLDVNKVKVVRMFPSSSSMPASATRYAFDKWFYGDFMAVLERKRIPLALEFSPHRRAEPEWDKLYILASGYPNLPIVLCDAFQRATWSLVKLMRLMPNIYVQTSGVGVHRQLEYMVGKVGPERFIAGSKFPSSHMGTMIGQVLFANLTYEHKKLIAGDNARRLMGISEKGDR
jgi:predicted TIM-barrel fold metal-dependent hydrolase